MIHYIDCEQVPVEMLQNIIIFSPAIPIVVVIIISLITFASCIPQYFRDLKDSRDKHISNSIREELRKEVIEKFLSERKLTHLQIEKLDKENKNLKGKIKKIETWIYNCQVDIRKEGMASEKRDSFIESYRSSQFDDIT